MSVIEEFLKEHRIEEVECLVPDMAGIARGKILPAKKFIQGMRNNGLRIPEAIFVQTVTGGYPPTDAGVINPATSDVYLEPDPNTICLVPWYPDPTAQVICDPYYFDGTPVPFAARHVLKRVLSFFEEKHWTPMVAIELEFYLVERHADPDYPLRPPIGRSGRRETSRQAYGVDAVNEFDPMFEEIYDFCEAEGIDIDTLTHEAGAAQMEMNFNHGRALTQADQGFLFKRTVREAGLRHQLYATFMSKPMQGEPGSSMHIHQSVVDELREWAPTKRAGGLNRWITSARLFAEVASADTVYLASGQNWPDALAGGAKAGSDHEPLLITRHDRLPGAIEDALERLYPERVRAIIKDELLEVRERFGDERRTRCTSGAPRRRA